MHNTFLSVLAMIHSMADGITRPTHWVLPRRPPLNAHHRWIGAESGVQATLSTFTRPVLPAPVCLTVGTDSPVSASVSPSV